SQQLAAGGQMADQLGLLAMVFGGIAVVLGSVGGRGGRGGSTTFMSILLEIAALSYPILNALNLVNRYVPNPIGGGLATKRPQGGGACRGAGDGLEEGS